MWEIIWRSSSCTGRLITSTKTEFDETIDNIQAALESNHSIGWRLSSIQYEDGTGLIHYEWDFWVS